jgi:hypothetical protein
MGAIFAVFAGVTRVASGTGCERGISGDHRDNSQDGHQGAKFETVAAFWVSISDGQNSTPLPWLLNSNTHVNAHTAVIATDSGWCRSQCGKIPGVGARLELGCRLFSNGCREVGVCGLHNGRDASLQACTVGDHLFRQSHWTVGHHAYCLYWSGESCDHQYDQPGRKRYRDSRRSCNTAADPGMRSQPRTSTARQAGSGRVQRVAPSLGISGW